MPFLELKKKLSQNIADQLEHKVTASQIGDELGLPPNPELGHVALACFKMAKTLHQSADKIAQLLSTQCSEEIIATPSGPYVNFRWKPQFLFEKTIPMVLREKSTYGWASSQSSDTLVIEYCSPNVAKKLGFQHIRSTLIGNALANIYQSQGFKTHRMNFVGDWGAQFARLLAAFAQWGNSSELSDSQKAMSHLMEVYVRFHKECEVDPAQIERANQWLKRLEEKDKGAIDLWKTIRDISIEQMNHTLTRMHVKFDHTEGESTYIEEMKSLISDIKNKAQAKLSEGAWIVELDGITTPALIQKRDGTTLYLTRDIAAAIDRFNRFRFGKMVYVVSEQQRLHFQQLFGTLKKMGYEWASTCEHVGFGTVLFGSEKMSTREGHVILLDDLLSEAHERALKECTEKNPALANKEEVAETVGIGAVIFGQLAAHRTRNIEFDWAQVLALDGETGPYVQYSAVRCRSLLEKARAKGLSPTTDFHGQFASEEDALIFQVARFQSELVRALRENDPFYLTSYLIDLSKTFNRFYFRLPVLQCTDSDTRHMRLSLVQATGQTLENGLSLLSIACPTEM